jgi:hypothetical protein
MKNQTLLRIATAALAALTVSSFTGCNSTTVKDTWTAPDLSTIRFTKIMVVVTSPDGATRRAAEDAVKAQITKAECVTSYSLIGSETDLKDHAKVSAALKSAGVDGVIVIRPVSDKNEISYTPGTPYPAPYLTFRGYYARPYGLSSFYYEPAQTTVDRIVQLETNIYEVAGDRLIWSGTTTSTNPGNLKQLAADAANAIRDELVKRKLIAQP